MVNIILLVIPLVEDVMLFVQACAELARAEITSS